MRSDSGIKPWERDWSQPQPAQPAAGGKPWEKYQNQQRQAEGLKPWERDWSQPQAADGNPFDQFDQPNPFDQFDGTDAPGTLPSSASLDAAIGAQQPAPEPPPPPTPWERAGGVANALNLGISNFLGLPIDAMNASPMLLNMLPGVEGVGRISDYPYGGSQSLQDALAALGLFDPDHQPVDGKQRIAERVAEEVGFSALPTGALAAKGMQLAQRGVALAEGPLGGLLQPFLKQPAKAAATETTLAGAAGAGAGAAREHIADTAGADIGGAVAGSLAAGGAMTATRGLSAALRAILAPEHYAKSVVDGDVGAFLARSATDADRAFNVELPTAQRLAGEVPGYHLTTGQGTNDPGLQALEYGRSKAGPNTGDFRVRQTQNNQALHTALEDLAPATLTDEALRRALEDRKAAGLGHAGEIVGRQESRRDAATAAAQPAMSKQEAGLELRRNLEEARASLERQRDDAAFPLLKQAEESGVAVDVRPVLQAIDDKLLTTKRDSVLAALNSVRSKLFASGSDQLDTSVAGLYETRKAINDIIAGRGDSSVARFAQSELTELRHLLDQQITAAEPRMAQYLEAYRDGSRPLDAFNRGPVANVLERDRYSAAHVTPDSDVVAQFFNAGRASGEALQGLEQALGGRAQAVRSVRAFALDDALAKATVNGQIEPRRLDAWLQRHQDALASYPEIRAQLGNVAEAEKTLRRYQRRQELLKDSLSNPRKSTIARYLDTDDARDSMASILGAKNKAREMTNLMNTLKGDKDAIEGARRAFFDLMTDGTSNNPARGIATGAERDLADVPLLASAKFEKFLRQNEQSARILFRDNPQHLERLSTISEATKLGQRVNQAKGGASSGTALQSRGSNLQPMNLAQYFSRGYAVARGVVSPLYIVLETTSRGVRRATLRVKKEQFDELLDRALLDPEVAKTLVMKYSDSTANVIGRRLRLHLGNEISTLASEDAEGERHDH